MLFNSLEFAVFFPVVTILFFVLPQKFRWMMLLISSCYFYMAFVPVYILIIGFTIVIDYFAGILIEQADKKRKKFFLVCSLIANIGVLAIFKYYNFLNENLSVLLGTVHVKNPVPYLDILLPIGLSFHTFQAMSYTIEVYRGHQKAERHFGIYALYVMFYPQMVAGPIERPQNMLHQFHETHKMDYQRMTDGLKLMAWGLFKKVVIADRLAIIVNQVYDDPYQFTGLSLLIATIFFSFQIFCDFSGYSDIAIGAAQVMGFKLMTNFNRPYSAKSISEFWSRWHISLSTWFRDYLYISLGGNRVSVPRWYFNLFFVFLVSGLWHGANWTFIVWGALHGFYLIFALATQNFRNKIAGTLFLNRAKSINKFLNIALVFFLVTFAWIFFRAKNLDHAIYIIRNMFSGLDHIPGRNELIVLINDLRTTKWELLIAFAAIALMELVHLFQNKFRLREKLAQQPAYFRWTVYYSVVLCILLLGVFEKQQFIYFQF